MMFTGIIQEIGRLAMREEIPEGLRLTVDSSGVVNELQVNDSIAVNGVCLTVVNKSSSMFVAEAVEETLNKTTLGSLRPDSNLNLELPLRLSDRLGGHLVQGHVDVVGEIRNVEKNTMNWLITISFPDRFKHYVIPVGSIAVDGISLTVAKLEGSSIVVSIIPHTLEKTTLSGAYVGMRVNLEFDLVGKYIEAIITSRNTNIDPLSWEKLRMWGYGA